jgi:heme/copper-type cytochrome/quinol oxidase subunit 2
MSGTVLIDTEEDYALWLTEQTTFAEMLANKETQFTNLGDP